MPSSLDCQSRIYVAGHRGLAGSAIVAGIPLTSDNGAEIRQRISIMPENPGLYTRLTVIENLELFAGLYGQRNPGTRINEALEAVNRGYMEVMPHLMSHNGHMMTAIIR